MQKAGELGMQTVKANLDELKKMIQEASKRQ